MTLKVAKGLAIGISAILTSLLVACGGGGGSSTASAPAGASTPAVVTPIPVQASSYENKIAAATKLGPQPLPSEVAQGNAVAFADFFQDGTYSMVTASCAAQSCGASSNGAGQIHFYKQVNGQWVDHTSDILSNATGCLHPRKAVVADFNNSGKPGVFISCIGTDESPYTGEDQIILLPQSNGQYTNTTIPIVAYAHSASAADFNGNGYADIVITDTSPAGNAAQNVYFLKNNGDGTFSKDTSRLAQLVPYDSNGDGNLSPGTLTAGGEALVSDLELIDFTGNGKYDLFIGGRGYDPEQIGDWPPTILYNQNNTYSQNDVTTLPNNPTFQVVNDVVFTNGKIYTSDSDQPAPGAQIVSYLGGDIEEYSGTNYGTMTQLWSTTANFPDGINWINYIIPYQGMIDALNSTYNVSVSQ
jgi:hypothetical protein